MGWGFNFHDQNGPFNGATTDSNFTRITAVSSVTAGNTVTGNFPANILPKDGDLVFALFGSMSNPTTAWATPTGWTLALAQRNLSSLTALGQSLGRGALFYKVWRTGDATTVDSSGPGGNCVVLVFVLRSDGDGANLTIGNPPASGIASITDQLYTGTPLSYSVPKFQPDVTQADLRIMFALGTMGAGDGQAPRPPASCTQVANNFFGHSFKKLVSGASGIIGANCAMSIWSDPSGADTTTTTWTSQGVGTNMYIICVVVHDPTNNNNGRSKVNLLDAGSADVVLEAVGLEEIVFVESQGGDRGIILFS